MVLFHYTAGASGQGHGSDYQIFDREKACVLNAKWQLTMISLLLGNGTERARKIVSEYKPRFLSKEEYFAYVDSFNVRGDRIRYHEDGTATIRL